mmetsp:Transcript_43222/g.137465  ORF Transcript_43222/g.137465 Transcript_43222/m.137465 type:complete len:283 (+) Transcript_43222:264-1112(+)
MEEVATLEGSEELPALVDLQADRAALLLCVIEDNFGQSTDLLVGQPLSREDSAQLQHSADAADYALVQREALESEALQHAGELSVQATLYRERLPRHRPCRLLDALQACRERVALHGVAEARDRGCLIEELVVHAQASLQVRLLAAGSAAGALEGHDGDDGLLQLLAVLDLGDAGPEAAGLQLLATQGAAKGARRAPDGDGRRGLRLARGGWAPRGTRAGRPGGEAADAPRGARRGMVPGLRPAHRGRLCRGAAVPGLEDAVQVVLQDGRQRRADAHRRCGL